MRPKEIQKAPYDEKAVAPNVFPAGAAEQESARLQYRLAQSEQAERTGKLPHACEQLCKSSVAEGETDNDIWDGDTACARVVEGEDKGGRSECHQT